MHHAPGTSAIVLRKEGFTVFCYSDAPPPPPTRPSRASLLREPGDKVGWSPFLPMCLPGLVTELISKANLWDSDDRYI